MPTMTPTTPTTHREVLEVAEHMPPGSTLVVNDFEWDQYELLLEDLDERHNPRLSYDCGRLEVVMTSGGHEDYSCVIDTVVRDYCEALDLIVQAYGGATWKKKSVAKGAEADCCFYIQNARKVIGKMRIPLESNPPPDLVVEVDLTTDSRRKLRIYAGLGVPEVWRFDGSAFFFHELVDGEYVDVGSSKRIPGFTPSLLIETLEKSRDIGQTEAIKAFRRSLKKLKK
jgi:Uma2 family endonuclease